MAKQTHSMLQQASDLYTIKCGEIRIADIHRDATGKHYTRVIDNTVNLRPSDLAFILSSVLHLDNDNISVQ